MPNSQPGPDEAPRLWTITDLAAFLGYKPSTVARLVSVDPSKLPPRVQGLGRPRWVRELCEEWVRQRSAATPPQAEARRRPGRPRRVA